MGTRKSRFLQRVTYFLGIPELRGTQNGGRSHIWVARGSFKAWTCYEDKKGEKKKQEKKFFATGRNIQWKLTSSEISPVLNFLENINMMLFIFKNV